MSTSGNEKFIQLQHQIRQNNYSIQDYISDLSDWTEEVAQKDVDAKEGKGAKAQNNRKLPPIRSQILEEERVKNKSSSYIDLKKKVEVKKPAEQPKVEVGEDAKEFKRDITPMPKYYNKWDQFDPEKAMEDIEKDKNIGFDKTLNKTGTEITKSSTNEKMYEPSPVDDMSEEERMQLEKEKFLKGTSGAKPNTKMVVKGGANPTPLSKIEATKKKGNNYFTSLDYEKAIEWYTKCLEMNPEDRDMKVTLYSNRAQWFLNLKQHKEAERDALSALRLDKTHLKSMFRHGTALYYLKRYKEAKHAFNNLLRMDPNNKNGIEYLKHTDQKLSKIKMEAYEKLYYGEINGDSTSVGVNVIRVEEIHMDPKLKKQIDEQHVSGSNHAPQEKENSKISEVNGDDRTVEERQSKADFLSKTDVSGITRDKEETK